MSVSAEEQLAKFGITVQQAFDFIFANLDDPRKIYIAAANGGVTIQMLHEITNVPSDIVCQYFESAELECDVLNDTSILLNRDFDILESLINFNENVGVLSNESIRERVEPELVSSQLPHIFFGFANLSQNIDDIYDSMELGVAHIDSVAANDENIESLFYGALINIYSAFDESELMQITTFPDDGDLEDFQVLLSNALQESPTPVVWTEEELSDLVVNEAVHIMNGYLGSGVSGRVDPLLLPSFWVDAG